MKPEKKNAKFDNYSYYITPANIGGEPHTILSTVGRVEQEIYYDQNVFKGTPEEVFEKSKATDDVKYSRLAEIFGNKKRGD